jgi:mRNA degradation ribonuclease J1/J2
LQSVTQPSGSCRCTASTATWSPRRLAEQMGTPAGSHPRCREDGDTLVLDDDGLTRGTGSPPSTSIYVDGKTVGEIGTGARAARPATCSTASLAASSPRATRRGVRRAAGSFVGEKTRRRPMIVPVVVEA